jgi:hypothetical protein
MPQDARHGRRECCGSSARTSKEVVLEFVPALLGLFTFDDQKCSRFQRTHRFRPGWPASADCPLGSNAENCLSQKASKTGPLRGERTRGASDRGYPSWPKLHVQKSPRNWPFIG